MSETDLWDEKHRCFAHYVGSDRTIEHCLGPLNHAGSHGSHWDLDDESGVPGVQAPQGPGPGHPLT